MSAKEKTLLVTLDFPPLVGGVANYYYERVKQMVRAGENIIVLAPSVFVIPAEAGIQAGKNWIPDQVGDDKTGVLIFRKNFFTKLLWPHWLPLIWHIYKIIKKEKITRLWVGQVLPVGTAVWLVSRLLSFRRKSESRIHFFVSCHGNDLLRAKKHPRKFKLAKRILKDAEFIEANTEFTKNILINDFQIPAEKIKIVYPVNTLTREMIDQKKVSELKEKYNLHNKKVLITIARLVESKGIDLILQALPKVWKNIPDLVYLIVGDGPDKERLTQITDKFSQIHRSNVVFTGSVPHLELPNYYALANAFILTPRSNIGTVGSKYPLDILNGLKSVQDTESFGIVYLEAKEFGLSIIASDVGGIKEAVKDYDKIDFVNPENINELTENIVKILEK